MLDDIPTISSFKELLNEIGYSWDYPKYDFIKHSDGSYSLNKLYIDPEMVSYKTSTWILGEGVFEEFEAFYNLLQMLERNQEHETI